MNHMTNYLKDKLLGASLRGVPFTSPTTVYVALFNGETEVSKVSYQRQLGVFADTSNGQTSNNTDILFPIATESWGAITHIGIFDQLEGGNMLFLCPAEFTKTIDVSSQYKVPKNYLIIRLR